MNKLNLLKTAFTEGCIFYTAALTGIYLLGWGVNPEWIPTPAMVLGLLAFCFLLGFADRFLFSDLLVFPLRLLIHYVGTAIAFWIFFGVLGSFSGSGVTVWLVYTFAYLLVMTIVLTARWLTADLRNQKQEYTPKYENDTYRPRFGGKSE